MAGRASAILITTLAGAIAVLTAACSSAPAPTHTQAATASAADTSPAASTTRRIYSWVGATQTPYSPPTSEPAPPGTPPCPAGALKATVEWQGATGSMAGAVTVTNTGAACSLSGPPRLVVLRDGDLALPVQYRGDAASGPGSAAAPAALLRPGGAATSSLVWSNLCTAMRPAVTEVLVTLPGGSDPVRATYDGQGPAGVPRCDFPGGPSTLTAYAFAPVEAEPTPPEPQPADVAVAPPGSVAAGGLLGYLVTLTNIGTAPAPLDPCPSFTEDLVVGGAALKPPGPERYLLPCGDLGPALARGRAVTMVMEYTVPAGVAPGPVQILWGMDPGGPLDPASGRAWLTVAGG